MGEIFPSDVFNSGLIAEQAFNLLARFIMVCQEAGPGEACENLKQVWGYLWLTADKPWVDGQSIGFSHGHTQIRTHRHKCYTNKYKVRIRNVPFPIHVYTQKLYFVILDSAKKAHY